MVCPPISQRRHRRGSSAGLGIAAIAYVGVDYLRHLSPAWHERLQPALWVTLAIAAVIRVPFYKHWSLELKAAIPFIFSMLFMLSALLFEAISVRSVTAVLGLSWHKETPPLPDVGQWLLLALNEKLPQVVVDIMRARIIGLHHFLMLFIMLGFSVLFNSVEAPGLGLGARYMFTMGIGRLLRAIAFVSTILPSPRPWCASARFQVPSHPHPWAQKYYVPYAKDSSAIRHIINHDIAYAVTGEYGADFQPNWGSMNFLADFLRPTATEGSSPWYHLLKKAGGGCNDLIYSGHMLVAVLTAMAWTEAYGGFTSAIIWMFVAHSAQREIRERHHYSVDCLLAIYMGIFLWKMVGLFWPIKDSSRYKRLNKLEKIQSRLVQAAKDSDMDEVRELLKEVELSSQVRQESSSRALWLFSGATILFALVIVVLALTLTSDG
ncbi:Sphingomyelin synthetase family protein [Perilla frutescens var. hirtella]|uniref:Sphingomyelin synthetase family protein n=1 Tax=Perilla frutescens var. hirtella TaxID=608512 RepID=A0AAD4P2D5_PERFH|nr:Sphingomyelin synthetase family protein [Perilla frutescens var. hirtella]